MSDWNEKVATAANRLHREGKKVTAESVRSEIGFGSLREICPALRAWRDTKAKADATASAIPNDVAAAFQVASNAAWAAAERLAAGRIAAIEASCNDRIGDAEAERDAALSEVTQVERQLDDLCKELLAARETVTQTAAVLARTEAERDAERSKVAWLTDSIASEKRATATALELAGELRGRIAAMSEVFENTQRIACTKTAA